MPAYGFRTLQRDQPPLGTPLSDALPRPWVNLRALGRIHVTTGLNPISSSNYVGNSARSTPFGRALYIDGIAGSGIAHTFSDYPERQRYAVAVLFSTDAAATTQTIFGINGGDNGIQVRINTSAQLEILSEGSALLATSTYAGFTVRTTHCLFLVADGTSTYVLANGQHILTYAGVVDNKLVSKYLTIGSRGGSTGEVLTGPVHELTMWSGTLPTLTQGMEISRDYYGTVFQRRRRAHSRVAAAGGLVFNPITGRGGAAAQPLAVH